MRLYVGNFPYQTTKEQLEEMFAAFGQLKEVRVNTNAEGKPAGFGFVEFFQESEGRNAIAQLHDTDFGGRKLKVSPARPRERASHSDRTPDPGRNGRQGDRRRGRDRDDY